MKFKALYHNFHPIHSVVSRANVKSTLVSLALVMAFVLFGLVTATPMDEWLYKFLTRHNPPASCAASSSSGQRPSPQSLQDQTRTEPPVSQSSAHTESSEESEEPSLWSDGEQQELHDALRAPEPKRAVKRLKTDAVPEVALGPATQTEFVRLGAKGRA